MDGQSPLGGGSHPTEGEGLALPRASARACTQFVRRPRQVRGTGNEFPEGWEAARHEFSVDRSALDCW